MNCSFFLCLAAFRMRSKRLDHASPALRPVRALLVRVSLGPGLGSTNSAAGRPALFIGFITTMPESDFSESCISGFGSYRDGR